METIYGILSALPFDWLHYDFMKNALLAVLLITPLFGLLSTMVVSNRMAFFSDSLGHGAFTGLAIGAILGIFSPVQSLLLFPLLSRKSLARMFPHFAFTHSKKSKLFYRRTGISRVLL